MEVDDFKDRWARLTSDTSLEFVIDLKILSPRLGRYEN